MEDGMITCLIVDDELNSRGVLKTLLRRFCPQLHILGEAENAEEAYRKITELRPQLVFLDVQMPGGNGFSLLRRFVEVPFQVIFVTSYDQYAIEAIRFSALYYLMKPIEVHYLKEAVSKLISLANDGELYQRQIINLLGNEGKPGIEKKLAVHSHDSVVFLSLQEVVFLEAMDEYTGIFTINGERYTSSKNLGKWEEMIAPYEQFFRIGKSFIINLNYIEQYTKGEPCFITVRGNYVFEVSRRKKQEFLRRMG